MLPLQLLLTFVWVVLTNELTLGNALFGFALAFLLTGLTERVNPLPQPRVQRGHYGLRLLKLIPFVLFFLKELVLASFDVLFTILRPSRLRPGVIAVPLDLKTDAQITLLGNLITLTPGTLTLEVSTNRRTLYVHTIRVDDPQTFRQQIKNGFEKRILEVTT